MSRPNIRHQNLWCSLRVSTAILEVCGKLVNRQWCSRNIRSITHCHPCEKLLDFSKLQVHDWSKESCPRPTCIYTIWRNSLFSSLDVLLRSINHRRKDAMTDYCASPRPSAPTQCHLCMICEPLRDSPLQHAHTQKQKKK